MMVGREMGCVYLVGVDWPGPRNAGRKVRMLWKIVTERCWKFVSRDEHFASAQCHRLSDALISVFSLLVSWGSP